MGRGPDSGVRLSNETVEDIYGPELLAAMMAQPDSEPDRVYEQQHSPRRNRRARTPSPIEDSSDTTPSSDYPEPYIVDEHGDLFILGDRVAPSMRMSKQCIYSRQSTLSVPLSESSESSQSPPLPPLHPSPLGSDAMFIYAILQMERGSALYSYGDWTETWAGRRITEKVETWLDSVISAIV